MLVSNMRPYQKLACYAAISSFFSYSSLAVAEAQAEEPPGASFPSDDRPEDAPRGEPPPPLASDPADEALAPSQTQAGTEAQQTPPAAVPPAQAPAPAASAPPPAASAQSPQVYPPPPQSPSYPAQAGYAAQPPGYQPPANYYNPPPPPQKPEDSSGLPHFSVRADPLNWLVWGELNLELEIQLWKIITFEVVPQFLTTESPLVYGDILFKRSNGLGPISGTSLGVGFWLDGKPFKGTVLRALFRNYGYEYQTRRGGVPQDPEDGSWVSRTERQLIGFLGSASRWGAFTMAGGVGVGVELEDQRRCWQTVNEVRTDTCPHEEQELALDNGKEETVDLNGALHPVVFMFRLSLGVSF